MSSPRSPVPQVAVIIPALDEEAAIAGVIAAIPAELGATVIVADNGSSDRTAEVAAAAGARVVREDRRGYGWACLAAMAAMPAETSYVVFLDGDGSDFPAEMDALLEPLRDGRADLVIGSRLLGTREPGAMFPHQVLANRMFTWLLGRLYRQSFTDLGPFRAIRRDALDALDMEDKGYGWTMEMQMKALRRGLRVIEVPVGYRKRTGESKISGRLGPSLRAGGRILWTMVRFALRG